MLTFGNALKLRRGGTWVGGGDAPEFPETLPDLFAWFDASDAESIGAASGGVFAWMDKSGNGRHAIQGTAGNRPTLQATGLNGQPSLRFDGSNDFLLLPSAGHLTQLTVAVVASASNVTGFRGLVGRTEGSPWRHNWVMGLDGGKQLFLYYNGSAYPQIRAASAVPTGTPTVLTARLTAAPAGALWRDGSLAATDVNTIAGTPVNFGTTVIGASDGGALSFWAGDISEVIVTGSGLSDGDVAALNAYLVSKWL